MHDTNISRNVVHFLFFLNFFLGGVEFAVAQLYFRTTSETAANRALFRNNEYGSCGVGACGVAEPTAGYGYC